MRRSKLVLPCVSVLVLVSAIGIGPCDETSGISGSPTNVEFKSAGQQLKITLSNAGEKVETIASGSPTVSPTILYKTFLLCEKKQLPCVETVECKVSGKGAGEFKATTVAGNVWKAVLKCP